MTIWNNRGFSENDLSPFARWLTGLVVGAALLGGAYAATVNAAHGRPPRPGGAVVLAVGLLLAAGASIRHARHRRLQGGRAAMTTWQSNAFRVGCFLAAIGFLLAYW